MLSSLVQILVIFESFTKTYNFMNTIACKYIPGSWKNIQLRVCTTYKLDANVINGLLNSPTL